LKTKTRQTFIEIDKNAKTISYNLLLQVMYNHDFPSNLWLKYKN